MLKMPPGSSWAAQQLDMFIPRPCFDKGSELPAHEMNVLLNREFLNYLRRNLTMLVLC